MTRLLGLTSAIVALALSLYGIVVAVMGVRQRRPELVRSARSAAYANFVLLAIANFAMVYALVTHDFSISYVAQVGSRDTPMLFTVISLWSSLEGSILFWGLVLSAYTAAATFFTRDRFGALGAYATATMLGVGAFFYLLLVGPANPFRAMAVVPPDGPGPNPLLQNHPLMAIHPPLLYLGYVGMTVPFAFAAAALLSGRLDDTWIRVTRRWTVTAWMFLSLAIIAGMWWSYAVLGWGGYWAWDPVENASFMPWLTATAFLHSVMVQERRDMLKVWNLNLIVSTFLLTILGTFLTRSGVLSSVHAFADGPIGWYFLGFIAVVLVFSFVLLMGRSSELHTSGKFDQPVSRETAFLLNNLLFTAFMFTVLLGTLFPLLAEAARGVKVSVGEPFYNKMTIPLCAALLFLVGVGPVLPWRGLDMSTLVRRLVVPGVAGVVAAGVALLLGTHNVYALLAFAFGAFAFFCNAGEFVTGMRARQRAHGENALVALGRLISGNNRRYGGYIAHIGVVIVATGIAGSSAFKQDKSATLKPGQTMSIGKYTVRFDGLTANDEPHRFVVGAKLGVLKGNNEVAQLEPKLNYYRTREEPITTPAVRSRFTNDLYINLLAFEQNGAHATVNVLIEPLVSWIWAGGLIVAFGGLIGVLPLQRKRRVTRITREQEVVAA